MKGDLAFNAELVCGMQARQQIMERGMEHLQQQMMVLWAVQERQMAEHRQHRANMQQVMQQMMEMKHNMEQMEEQQQMMEHCHSRIWCRTSGNG